MISHIHVFGRMENAIAVIHENRPVLESVMQKRSKGLDLSKTEKALLAYALK